RRCATGGGRIDPGRAWRFLTPRDFCPIAPAGSASRQGFRDCPFNDRHGTSLILPLLRRAYNGSFNSTERDCSEEGKVEGLQRQNCVTQAIRGNAFHCRQGDKRAGCRCKARAIEQRAFGREEKQMAQPAQAHPSRGRWYVLLLISVMYLITYLDRVNISTAAPLISKEFGFDKVTMGVIFSAFVWAYALFQVPGGWLSDRFGARKVLGSVVGYWSIMTALTGAAFSATSFIVIRFLFGVGEAGAFPGATRAMQLWYPRQERGFVQGITHSASRAGAAIAPPIVLLIMLNLGWRWAFLICGAIGLLWSLWWSFSYRNLPEEHDMVNRAELESIRGLSAQGTINPPQIEKQAQVPWAVLLRSANMWAIMLAYF